MAVSLGAALQTARSALPNHHSNIEWFEQVKRPWSHHRRTTYKFLDPCAAQRQLTQRVDVWSHSQPPAKFRQWQNPAQGTRPAHEQKSCSDRSANTNLSNGPSMRRRRFLLARCITCWQGASRVALSYGNKAIPLRVSFGVTWPGGRPPHLGSGLLLSTELANDTEPCFDHLVYYLNQSARL